MSRFKSAALLGLGLASGARAASKLSKCANYAESRSRDPMTNLVRGIPQCETYSGKIVSTADVGADQICTDRGVHGFVYGDSGECVYDYPSTPEEEEGMLSRRRMENQVDNKKMEDDTMMEIREEAKKMAAAAVAAAAAAAASGADSTTSSFSEDPGRQGDTKGRGTRKEKRSKKQKKNHAKKFKKNRSKLLKRAIADIEKYDIGPGKQFSPSQWQDVKAYLNEKENGKLTSYAQQSRDKLLVKAFGKKWKTQPNFGMYAKDRASSTYYASAGTGMKKKQREELAKLMRTADWGSWWVIFKLLTLLQTINMVLIAANRGHGEWQEPIDRDWSPNEQRVVRLQNAMPNWLVRVSANTLSENLGKFLGNHSKTAFLWIYNFLTKIGWTKWAILKSLGRNLFWTIITLIGKIPGGEQLSMDMMMENFPGDVPYYMDNEDGETDNQLDGISPLSDEIAGIWKNGEQDDNDNYDGYDSYDDDNGYDYGGGYKHRTQKRKKKRKKTKKKKKSKKRRKKKHKKTRRKS